MKKFFLFGLMFSFVLCSFAQKGHKANATVAKGHDITFTVKHSSDSMLYLVFHFRDKLMLKDSARAIAPGKFNFKGDEVYNEGLFMIVNQDKKPYMNFVMPANQYFSMVCDTANDPHKIEVYNSPENEEMLIFERRSFDAGKEIARLREEKGKLKKEEKIKACQDKMEKINDDMTALIDSLIDSHPDYLFSKMQKVVSKPIEIPEPPVREDGTIDSNFKFNYYLNHYFDNVDFTDHRLLYTPAIEPKLTDYFLKTIYYQPSDTINKYIDIVLDRALPDSMFYRFLLEWLTYRFESSKIIGHDAVFVHIAKNNQLAGKATWMDEDLIKKYEKRVKNLSPILIGEIAPEIIMPDTTQTDDWRLWKSSYAFRKPYVILWFYDPDCPTCNKETVKLKQVYDSLETAGVRNFDVYGVSADDDLKRWKKYLNEKQVKWINVGGMKANIDYMHQYNIYESGTPSMFIFDNETKKIILNRRIEMHNIPEFLNQYEKKFKNKLN